MIDSWRLGRNVFVLVTLIFFVNLPSPVVHNSGLFDYGIVNRCAVDGGVGGAIEVANGMGDGFELLLCQL